MKLTKAFEIFAVLGTAIQNRRISHRDRSIAWAYIKVDRFFVLPTIAYEHVEYDLTTEVHYVKRNVKLGRRYDVEIVAKREWVKRFFFMWGNRSIRINYGCRTGFLAVQE